MLCTFWFCVVPVVHMVVTLFIPGIEVIEISDEAKELDLKLAIFVGLHCPIKSIDHLTEVLKGVGRKLGPDNPLSKIKLHRTKCTKLITAVIAPAYLNGSIQDIGSSKFAIIADESTDVSSIKYLALCIRFGLHTIYGI